MPIYDYECAKCSTVFETFASINSTEKIPCEKCGSTDTRKLISAPTAKIVSGSKSEGECRPRGGFS